MQAENAGSSPAGSTSWECCRWAATGPENQGGVVSARGSIPPLPATERWQRGRLRLGANQVVRETRGFESRPFLRRRDGRAARHWAADPASRVRLPISSHHARVAEWVQAAAFQAVSRRFDSCHVLCRVGKRRAAVAAHNPPGSWPGGSRFDSGPCYFGVVQRQNAWLLTR